MWPDCAAGSDLEGFDTEDFAVVDDIVSLSKTWVWKLTIKTWKST
jgi:hypothetical protein